MIFDIIQRNNIWECDSKWYKLINRFNENCDIYYQYIEPKLSDFELFLFLQKDLLVHQTKIQKNIDITINEIIPDNISSGIIIIIDNVLLYIKTKEDLKPINDQTNNIKKCQSKLLNNKFIENAKIELVENEKKKLIDFTNLQNQKTLNLLFNNFGSDIIKLLLEFHSIENIYSHIQYFREQNYKLEKYTKTWFDSIYNININQLEIIFLKNLKH